MAGTPAIIVILAFVVAPLAPLSPREVCRKFNAASNLGEAKQYTTTKLWPALAAFDKPEVWVNTECRTDLTTEGEGDGCHLVGWRVYSPATGEVTEGLFQLVNYEGTWQIDEIYFTSYKGQVLPSPVAWSTNYQAMLAASTTPQSPASQFVDTTRAAPRAPVPGLEDQLMRAGERAAISSVNSLAAGEGRALASGAAPEKLLVTAAQHEDQTITRFITDRCAKIFTQDYLQMTVFYRQKVVSFYHNWVKIFAQRSVNTSPPVFLR